MENSSRYLSAVDITCSFESVAVESFTIISSDSMKMDWSCLSSVIDSYSYNDKNSNHLLQAQRLLHANEHTSIDLLSVVSKHLIENFNNQLLHRQSRIDWSVSRIFIDTFDVAQFIADQSIMIHKLTALKSRLSLLNNKNYKKCFTCSKNYYQEIVSDLDFLVQVTDSKNRRG